MIGIIGGGSWGSALAHVISQKNKVMVYDNDSSKVDHFNLTKECFFLPGYKLNGNVSFTRSMSDLDSCTYIFVVIPVKHILSTCKNLNSKLVFASKGLIEGKLISDFFPGSNFLYGPSHAEEVISGSETSVLVSGPDKTFIRDILNLEWFHVSTIDDHVSIEVASALKNVYAIYFGYLSGKKTSFNQLCAEFYNVYLELKSIIRDFGGTQPENLVSLSDLMVTCFSENSRNFMYGKSLVSGTESSQTMVVEGLNTLQNFDKSYPILDKIRDLIP